MDKKTESGAGFLHEYWSMSRGLVMRKRERAEATVDDPRHPQRRGGFCMTLEKEVSAE